MSEAPAPTIDVPPALADLNKTYSSDGHVQWFVGGCVRDALMGVPCKDVDLATTATPEQQIASCEAAGLHWIGTGLQHGTITVVAGGVPYEITTLRRDVETDGRHAVVEWTQDIVEDLGRRDLTVNAIAMTFDGTIVDPFGGVQDILDRRIRFVGDAATRIREDHLRILRWFRFLGRFGNRNHDAGDAKAIADHPHLLETISVERVWSEMQRIVAGPDAVEILAFMGELGVLDAIGAPAGDAKRLSAAATASNNPAFLLAAWQGETASRLLVDWKASKTEQETAGFAAMRLHGRYSMGPAMLDLIDGADRDLVLAVLGARGDRRAVKVVETWEIPVFPLQGRDLVAAGMKPGKAIGERLTALRGEWISSGFASTREELLALPRDGD